MMLRINAFAQGPSGKFLEEDWQLLVNVHQIIRMWLEREGGEEILYFKTTEAETGYNYYRVTCQESIKKLLALEPKDHRDTRSVS